jgi:integrase
VERWKREHGSITLGRLSDEFIDSRDGISAKHERSLRYTKDRFKPLWPVRVCNLTHTEIEDVLWGLPPHSFNAHLRRIRSILNYGVKHKYLAENPALRLEPRFTKRSGVETLPIQAVERMLRIAEDRMPELLPFLTIALFTGVRVEEIGRLRWSDFNSADKILVIKAEISKTGKRRFIPLADNHLAWLSLISGRPEKRVLALTPTMLRNRRRKLWRLMRAEDATLPRHAPPNCLRHAFSSYHLAKYDNIAELCRQSGHSSVVMFDHYHHAVTRSDADRYWQITPSFYSITTS